MPIGDHAATVEWATILHGAIHRAAERRRVAPETVALALAYALDQGAFDGPLGDEYEIISGMWREEHGK